MLNAESITDLLNYGIDVESILMGSEEKDITKDRIPVGKPMEGAKAIILDKDNNICDIGVSGEIHIRTDFSTYGYYNLPKLNKEKFIQNPFSSRKGDLIYKTGDIGRLLPDGNIELLGRIDRQVKIRGNRIELDEVENMILKYGNIKEVVVTDKKYDDGDKYLCGYIVSEKEIITSELREYLESELPDYMIPSYFIELDKLPINPNGKIDRNALPEPDHKINTGTVYVAPRNEKEKVIN